MRVWRVGGAVDEHVAAEVVVEDVVDDGSVSLGSMGLGDEKWWVSRWMGWRSVVRSVANNVQKAMIRLTMTLGPERYNCCTAWLARRK